LLGVTATPKRSDGELLNQVFDRKVYEYYIEDAVREGWLVNLRCWHITTESNLDNVHRLGDDLKLDELAKAVNNPARNKLIVDEWERLAADRPTVVFAVDVKHAKDLAKEFKKRKVKVAAVWGNDPEREEKLEKFDAGKLQVLVNCELLTEGWDWPAPIFRIQIILSQPQP
jgi:superfamily II DNA or RNA helicase